MSKKTKKEPKSATIRVESVRPPRPRVDKDMAFEQLVRQMFAPSVDEWCKAQMDEIPSKDVRGGCVDNLTASFTSVMATLVESATDSYLSTGFEGVDDDVECPECGHTFEAGDPEPGQDEDEFTCPKCDHDFILVEDDDDDEDDEDTDDDEESVG